MKKKKRRYIIIEAILIAIFIAGLGIYLTPKVLEIYNERKMHGVIEDFNEDAKGNTIDIEGLYAACLAYNQALYENKQSGIKDTYSYEVVDFDLRDWGFEENIIGSIIVPKMDIELPIYMGASEENMRKGAVLLAQTSLPVGGDNSNAVIAGHRGYSGAPMFRNIESLSLGDPVYVQNFKEKLTYRVVGIKIIKPSEVETILIQEDKDMITLSTCHPYRINDQRYLVFCEREK